MTHDYLPTLTMGTSDPRYFQLDEDKHLWTITDPLSRSVLEKILLTTDLQGSDLILECNILDGREWFRSGNDLGEMILNARFGHDQWRDFLHSWRAKLGFPRSQ